MSKPSGEFSILEHSSVKILPVCLDDNEEEEDISNDPTLKVHEEEDALTLASSHENEYEQYDNSYLSGTKDIEKEQILYLKEQGYPEGLVAALVECSSAFLFRTWVVDNSGSMQLTDGHRVVERVSKKKLKNKETTANKIKCVSCTRWEELRGCVNYQAGLAGILKAPTTFRLLNHPGKAIGSQQFSVATSCSEKISEEVKTAKNIMNKARPGGSSEITSHIESIKRMIEGLSPELLRLGRRVAIVIATDALPTDEQGVAGDAATEEFVEALRALEGFPVWIVVRLCTDEKDVVDFYNELDDQLELSMEVLDDFVGEAKNVYQHNKWLNYALPLHHSREMGFYHRLFDILNERPLTRDELKDFFALLFGEEKVLGAPDPSIDWVGFMKEIKALIKCEDKIWNPVKKKCTRWVNMKKLNRIYRNDGGNLARFFGRMSHRS